MPSRSTMLLEKSKYPESFDLHNMKFRDGGMAWKTSSTSVKLQVELGCEGGLRREGKSEQLQRSPLPTDDGMWNWETGLGSDKSAEEWELGC